MDEPGTYLFGGIRTLPITNVQREFERGRKASPDVNQKVTVHGLRHSYATNAITSGCNIAAVSKQLGHPSVDITLKVYTHLFQESENQMMATMEELHGKAAQKLPSDN